MVTKATPLTLVLLVRHGLTPTTGTKLPGRAPGLHLSEAGEAQAETVAERIGPLADVAAVYASPLERAQETAAPIARATGDRVRTLPTSTNATSASGPGSGWPTSARRKDW